MSCALGESIAWSFWFAYTGIELQPCEWVRSLRSSVLLVCCAWSGPFTLFVGGREPSALRCSHLAVILYCREPRVLAASSS